MSGRKISSTSPKEPWREMFEKLKKYQKKHGNINQAPSAFKRDPKLGRWTGNQRLYYKHYKNGNKNKRASRGMCEERINLMQSIGFKFKINTANNTSTSSDGDDGGDGGSASTSTSARASSRASSSAATQSTSTTTTSNSSSTSNSTKKRTSTKATSASTPTRNPNIPTTRSNANASDHTNINTPTTNPTANNNNNTNTSKSHTNQNNTIKLQTSSSNTTTNPTNPTTTKTAINDLWQKAYEKLVTFKQKHGHVNVKPSTNDREEKRIYLWSSHQRTEYKYYTAASACKKSGGHTLRTGMTEERIELLNNIGFNFDDSDNGEDKDNDDKDNDDKDNGDDDNDDNDNGDDDNDDDDTDNDSGRNSPIANKTRNGRNALMNDNFSLTHRRTRNVKRAESVEWENKFKDLEHYKKIHGHVNVPRRYTADPKLGKWVDYQRTGYKSYKKGKKKSKNGMNLGRIRRLEQLGFKWTIRGLRKQSKSVANTPPLNTSPKASSPRTVSKTTGANVKATASTPTSKSKLKPTKKESREKVQTKKEQKDKTEGIAGMKIKEEEEETKNEDKEDEIGDRSIAEIILRKYGLFKGSIDYTSFKSLGHYYYLKNNQLLDK